MEDPCNVQVVFAPDYSRLTHGSTGVLWKKQREKSAVVVSNCQMDSCAIQEDCLGADLCSGPTAEAAADTAVAQEASLPVVSQTAIDSVAALLAQQAAQPPEQVQASSGEGQPSSDSLQLHIADEGCNSPERPAEPGPQPGLQMAAASEEQCSISRYEGLSTDPAAGQDASPTNRAPSQSEELLFPQQDDSLQPPSIGTTADDSPAPEATQSIGGQAAVQKLAGAPPDAEPSVEPACGSQAAEQPVGADYAPPDAGHSAEQPPGGGQAVEQPTSADCVAPAETCQPQGEATQHTPAAVQAPPEQPPVSAGMHPSPVVHLPVPVGELLTAVDTETASSTLRGAVLPPGSEIITAAPQHPSGALPPVVQPAVDELPATLDHLPTAVGANKAHSAPSQGPVVLGQPCTKPAMVQLTQQPLLQQLQPAVTSMHEWLATPVCAPAAAQPVFAGQVQEPVQPNILGTDDQRTTAEGMQTEASRESTMLQVPSLSGAATSEPLECSDGAADTVCPSMASWLHGQLSQSDMCPVSSGECCSSMLRGTMAGTPPARDAPSLEVSGQFSTCAPSCSSHQTEASVQQDAGLYQHMPCSPSLGQSAGIATSFVPSLQATSCIQQPGWDVGSQHELAAVPTKQGSVCRSSGGSSGASNGAYTARPGTAGSNAVVLSSPALQQRPMTAFPMDRLQTAMGSGLSSMRDRLKTAVERETHLRLESEMAAVDREELMHAKALAEANAELDRQMRLQAELELDRLDGAIEEERRKVQQDVSQLRGELRALHAAIRALEKQVVSLQAELGAEVRRREAAEQQLEHQIRRQTRPSMVDGQGPAEDRPVAQNGGVPQPQGTIITGRTAEGEAMNQPTLPPIMQHQQGYSPDKLPYLGRLQTEATTPIRPARTPRPFLHDVKQWLHSKQMEAAPWASLRNSIPCPPRLRTGSFRQVSQQQQQQRPSLPAAPPPQSQEHCHAQFTSSAPRSRSWQRQDSSPNASCSDPDSPEHQSFSRRRQQRQQQSGWTFKPAWNGGGGGQSPSPRAANRDGGATGSGYRVDQVLSELNDGLEQLRRSYSPPGSPYHTSTTLPALPTNHPPPPPAQQPQHYLAPSPLAQQPAQSNWGFQPAALPGAMQLPYGFDTRHITSLLMPSPPPAPSSAPQMGGAPIIQYSSTHHFPSGGAAGTDPTPRPPTAAVPGMQPPPLGQPAWAAHMGYSGMVQPPSLPAHQSHYPLAPPHHQQPFMEQRPYTPAVDLNPCLPPPAAYTAAAGQPPLAGPACAEVPPSPTGVLAAGLPSRHTTGMYAVPGTARPRSPGRSKDKPLAVPPQQMEEGPLAEARMQYMLDKHRIKAKRMRELQASPDFTLGG